MDTGIESAFLKGNTRVNLLNVGVPETLSRHIQRNQKITIKLELDTTPPSGATTEVMTHLMPTPFQVRLYDLSSLFAGKIHALLYRKWKTRVKGRDFYDFVWYVSRRISVNLPHLEARIVQSGDPDMRCLTVERLKSLLLDRFASVDFASAADEVRPFLRDPRELSLWSESFFVELLERASL